MGTWSAAILGNDTSSETYERFFELYDSGSAVAQIVKTIEKEMRDSLALDEDRNNVTLALALALWECDALNATRLARVRALVASRRDLEVWAGLDAGAALLKRREAALKTFLRRVSTPRSSPRKRKPPARPQQTPFRAGCCFTVKSASRHYAFWVVTAALGKRDGDLGVACLDIESARPPTVAQCERAYVCSVEKAGVDYPRGTWRGRKELLFYYTPDGPSFHAALEKHCSVVGYTAAITSYQLVLDCSGTALDLADSRNLVRRLVGLRAQAKREHWPRKHRLGELVAKLGMK
jgi:hypothetical protein